MQIGPYILRERLGEGGMATVWSGTHSVLGTPVAIKFLRSDRGAQSPDRIARFLDETRALARMRHPGIVSIFDAGLTLAEIADHVGDTSVGSPYLVMEAVGGGTLEQQPLSSWDACQRVLRGLLDALAHAHARGVIHRDLKPSNVLVDEFGRLRLTDFGIARLREGGSTSDRVTGTPHYMAPEQVAGDAVREGPWTDLYALGCLAFWLTTGAPPFRGEVDDVLSAQMERAPPTLDARYPVPAGFANWCTTLLQKDPQARFMRASDAAIALAALGDVDEHPTDATEPVFEVAQTTIISDEKDAEPRVVAAGTGSTFFEPPPPPSTWRTPGAAARDLALLSSARMVAIREPLFRGREDERDWLWDVLRRVWIDRTSHVVAVQGEPGTGQRAIIRWLARRAHETGAAHLLIFDDDLEASLRRQLTTWFRSVGGSPGATAFYAARGPLDALAEWDVEEVGRIVDGGTVSTAALEAVHARWTARLAADRAVIYVGEDPVVAALLRRAAAIAEARRLALYPTPTATEDETLHLEPLARDHIAATVRDIAGLVERTAFRFADAADGNPGAAIGWARLAARNGLLVESALGYDIGPDALRDLIASQNEHWVAICASLDDEVARFGAAAAQVSSWIALDELAALCGEALETVLAELAESGLVSMAERTLRYTHPGARQALLGCRVLGPRDYERIWRAFDVEPYTPRRRVIATAAGFRCESVSLTAVIETSRDLRSHGHLGHARELLRDVFAQLAPSNDRTLVGVELVEGELANQDYTAAAELVQTLDQNHPNVFALAQHITLRGLRNVEVEDLLAIDTAHLSAVSARMLSYALADFGEFDRARACIEGIEEAHDRGGRRYALARLEFVQHHWAEAAEHARRAMDSFIRFDRPDGASAARDLLASSLLELDDPSALDLYRENLRIAERLGIPAIASRYNLGLAMLKLGAISEETELLLERATADALQRGRTDIAHCGRAAQVLYAVLDDNETLAADRLTAIENHELGPWVQEDSVYCLERAAERASPRLRPRIEAVLADVREAVA